MSGLAEDCGGTEALAEFITVLANFKKPTPL
jgi:hypothetical protein